MDFSLCLEGWMCIVRFKCENEELQESKTLICVETLSLSTHFSSQFFYLQELPLENLEPWCCAKRELLSPPCSGCWLALGEIIFHSSSLWVHFCFPRRNHELSWKNMVLRGFDFVFGWLWGWVNDDIVYLLWDLRKVPHLDPKLTPFFFLLLIVITLGLISKWGFILFYA